MYAEFEGTAKPREEEEEEKWMAAFHWANQKWKKKECPLLSSVFFKGAMAVSEKKKRLSWQDPVEDSLSRQGCALTGLLAYLLFWIALWMQRERQGKRERNKTEKEQKQAKRDRGQTKWTGRNGIERWADGGKKGIDRKKQKKRKMFANNGVDKRLNKGHRTLHRTTNRDTGPESTAPKLK